MGCWLTIIIEPNKFVKNTMHYNQEIDRYYCMELYNRDGSISTRGIFVDEVEHGFWLECTTEKIYYAR